MLRNEQLLEEAEAKVEADTLALSHQLDLDLTRNVPEEKYNKEMGSPIAQKQVSEPAKEVEGD